MQASNSWSHPHLRLVTIVAALAGAAHGALPGWSPSGEWQSGNVLNMANVPGSNYFRFLPWTLPGASDEIRQTNTAVKDRCTQNVERVGPNGEVYAVRKNVCAEAAPPKLALPTQPKGAAASPTTPSPTTPAPTTPAVTNTAAPVTSTAVGQLATAPSPNCVQTIEESFEECREEVSCKPVKSLVCHTSMKKVCTMMEERCEPARCLEVLRTVCDDNNQECTTKLVRECGKRVNCSGGMSEECGEVPEQKCGLEDTEECARTPVCSPTTRQITRNVC